MILHKTHARWEAGAIPSRELIARVGALMGELAASGQLLGAEGLRASAEGVRLRFSGGKCTAVPGPFPGEKELPAGFAILRVSSREEAVQWATRLASILGEGELDVRPVTEPWDIGMMPTAGERADAAIHGAAEGDACIGGGSGALPCAARGDRPAGGSVA
jgi:hypothetical protein